RDCARRLAEAGPAEAGAHLLLGLLLLDEGAADRAGESLRRAAFLDAANPLAHFGLGRALAGAGEARRARAAFARAGQLLAGQPVDVLVARVRGEEYALELRRLTGVQPLLGLTPVPGTPAHVAGLVNVRGEVHTVLDLGATLDLVGERAVGEASRVLLVETA